MILGFLVLAGFALLVGIRLTRAFGENDAIGIVVFIVATGVLLTAFSYLDDPWRQLIPISWCVGFSIQLGYYVAKPPGSKWIRITTAEEQDKLRESARKHLNKIP